MKLSEMLREWKLWVALGLTLTAAGYVANRSNPLDVSAAAAGRDHNPNAHPAIPATVRPDGKLTSPTRVSPTLAEPTRAPLAPPRPEAKVTPPPPPQVDFLPVNPALKLNADEVGVTQAAVRKYFEERPMARGYRAVMVDGRTVLIGNGPDTPRMFLVRTDKGLVSPADYSKLSGDNPNSPEWELMALVKAGHVHIESFRDKDGKFHIGYFIYYGKGVNSPVIRVLKAEFDKTNGKIDFSPATGSIDGNRIVAMVDGPASDASKYEAVPAITDKIWTAIRNSVGPQFNEANLYANPDGTIVYSDGVTARISIPGSDEISILMLSDGGGMVSNLGYDPNLGVFTAERGGERVYSTYWFPLAGIKYPDGQPMLWMKKPFAPPPPDIIEALKKNDPDVMRKAVEKLNPGPEFRYYQSPGWPKLNRAPDKMNFRQALLLAADYYDGERIKLELPSFPLPAWVPSELKNAPDAGVINLGGADPRQVFAVLIGGFGELNSDSDQMAMVVWDDRLGRYRLYIRRSVLEVFEYMNLVTQVSKTTGDVEMSHLFMRASLAFGFRAACEAEMLAMIDSKPELAPRQTPTLAFCNAYYFTQAEDPTINSEDYRRGWIAVTNNRTKMLEVWEMGNLVELARRVLLRSNETNRNDTLWDWQRAFTFSNYK